LKGVCEKCSRGICLTPVQKKQRDQDNFFDSVKGDVDGGIVKIEKLNTDISRLSIPNIINEFENWAKENIMDPIVQVTQDISNTISEAEGKLSEIETEVNRLAKEVKDVIEDGVDAAKSTAISVGDFLSDTAMKVKSKAEEVWKDATTPDPILMECLRALSTEVASALDKAGEFGDLVQKALTEMISPHKCMVCADKLTTQQRAECGCSDEDRRLSGSLWYAIDKYGPGNNLEKEEEPPVNDTSVSVKTNTFSQSNVSSTLNR
jgi:gas vesicle protein